MLQITALLFLMPWLAGAAAPVMPGIDPPPGVFERIGLNNNSYTLTLNISTASYPTAHIRYTVNGATPTASTGTLVSAGWHAIVLGPFHTAAEQTFAIKAVAFSTTDAADISGIYSGSYIVRWPRVAAPTFSPKSDHSLIGASNIAITSSAVVGAYGSSTTPAVYWSIGFAAPTTGSTLYTAPVVRETAGEFVLRFMLTQ